MIISNVLWITLFAIDWDYYDYMMGESDLWAMVGVIAIAAISDVVLIEPKYLPYACRSYREYDEDDYRMD